MGELGHLIAISRNLGTILRHNPKQQRAPLFFTYLKMKLKQIFLINFLGKKITTETLFDFKMNFFDYPLFVLLFDSVFIGNDYFFSSTTNHPFIIDCGSNIGMSLLFFKKLFPKARITAFEPDPTTFTLLQKNVNENALSDVTLYNYALSNVEGEINFFYDPNAPGSLTMSLLEERTQAASKPVKAVLLSSYIDKEVDFLKMDIEGAELNVIQELSDTKKLTHIKEMAIEYHHHIDTNEDKLSKLLAILEQNNFGYQLGTSNQKPFQKNIFQDVMIYAYQKQRTVSQ